MRSRSAGVASIGHQVVVVQVHAPRADFAEQRGGIDRDRAPVADDVAERIAAAVADGPEAKREFVLGTRGVRRSFMDSVRYALS